MRKIAVLALVCAACASHPSSPPPPPPPTPTAPPTPSATASTAVKAPDLAFTIQEGRIDNRFFRDGKVAAHVLATSGDSPRLVFAFPAGNMGIGLWFEGKGDLVFEGALSAVERADGMRGVTANVKMPDLRVKQALLSSIRALRDYGHDGRVPQGMDAQATAGVYKRTTLDGKHHLELAIEKQPNGVVRFTALSDEPPLTAIPPKEILTKATTDQRSLDVLSFLTYDEKLLAGSWQYLTYFGRDTLLSTRLLLPALSPRVVEAALGSVIERLDATGDVAHEEDIGEWAVLDNMKKSPRPVDLRQPVYDYKMVDDDFLLAPVLVAYLDTAAGKGRAQAFFAKKTTAGATFADAVKKNLARVISSAEPFAKAKNAKSLVHIRDDLPVGNWRDSETGLGGGRMPYDVNCALVPAALRAAARLYAMDAFGHDAASATRAETLAKPWADAEKLFRVSVPAAEAKKRVEAYAKDQGVDAKDALAAIDGPVTFPALSLAANGSPLPIENSDIGFVMMFVDPSADWLLDAAKHVTMPFPAGLRTPVGIVVANPAYTTDAALRGLFTRDHYHGTVIWSWQQALLLAGLRRQIARTDLPAPVKEKLAAAEKTLREVIEANAKMRTSELWSWNFDAGGWHVVPFGQGKGHHTEANAAQLWSTVYLGLTSP